MSYDPYSSLNPTGPVEEPGFYMVQGPRDVAIVRHQTLLSAVTEANRLANKHPGQEFFVVQAISSHRIDLPAVTTRKLATPKDT